MNSWVRRAPVRLGEAWLCAFGPNAGTARSIFTVLPVQSDPLTGPLAVRSSLLADAVKVVEQVSQSKVRPVDPRGRDQSLVSPVVAYGALEP
ncbi:hypothetical protein Vau01_052190 [Virgisporangium aurantiacum]|uniref:Uncharacterized protein n=1 Tax=Virgisporangium aurantiacum TaxID=175570 RepID=A0A8J4E1F3_9ACTN|nr:hypothetical protein Vau01_052190 [Virgisporangium aurantiacum]